MRRVEACGSSAALLPRAGEPARLVDMTVHRHQRLVLINEAPDGNASNVRVQRRVINHFSIKVCPIEFCIVGRGMEEKHRTFEIPPFAQSLQIVLNRSIDQFLTRNIP